ncbi:MAG: tryptophan 2,3-dioxygenase [Gemmatimonadales bacterium]|nr:tryptophan 2,3-dioxygenase [Gemmatimonadales bacterium]
MPLTYSSYLKLDELLGLQVPLSDGPEHDETLFIIIHQVYELWFKEVVHELDYLGKLLLDTNTSLALQTLKRVLTILKVLVAQIDILETINPLDFLSFRDRLESGSGFQSFQFRELEFVLGRRDRKSIERFPEGSEGRRRLEARYRQSTLWDVFLKYLADNGYAIPTALLDRDLTQPPPSSAAVQEILTDIYRTNPSIVPVCERLVDLDEGLQEWRYRHVKMVERTIGTRRGTGGSAGAEYLKTTLMRPAFPDLWVIRTEL